MKNKKILCLITAFVILFTSVGLVFAEKNNNAYEAMYFLDADEYSSGLSKNSKYNCLGIAKKNHYVLYKDVDFGEDTARFIDISYAVIEKYAGGTLNVYVDEMSDSNLCAEVTSASTGSWTVFSSSHIQLSEDITGKHDIYFLVTSDYFGNLRSFNFSNNSAETEKAEEDFLKKINSKAVENYSSVFSEYAEILKINTAEFEGNEDFVYKYINENVPYGNFPAFKMVLGDAVLLANINAADSSEKIESIIQNNPELISGAYSEFVQKYKTMDKTEVCSSILSLIKNEKISSKSEFANVFNTAVCSLLYAECDNAEALYSFLESCSAYLKLDNYSDFKKLSERSRNNILSAVLGTQFEELNNSFSAAYAAEVKRLEENLRSAYDENNFFDADYVTDGLTKNTQFTCISNTFNGRYIRYDELDFGDIAARALDFTYGATEQYTGVIKIYIDNITSSNEVASLVTTSTGDWHTWSTVTVPLLKSVSGIHDVYIWFGGVVGDVKSMQFYRSKIVNTSDTKLTFYKNGSETSKLNEADKIAASGSTEVINDGKTKVSIIANLFDENMTPLTECMISSLVLQSGVENIVSLEKDIDNTVSPEFANAFVMDDSFVLYGAPAISGMGTAENVKYEERIVTKVKDTRISVFGKSDSAYSVIGVREKSKDRADFENYSFIVPVKNSDNSYSVAFNAPAKMMSGDYIAVAFDGMGNYYESEFGYVDESDINSVLDEINAAKESEGVPLWQAIKNIAEKNERYLGINTTLANLMPEWVYTNLANGIPYENLYDLQSNYNFYAIVSKIPNNAEADKVIDENREVLGISDDKCAEKYRSNNSIRSGAAKRVSQMLEKEMTDTKEKFLKAYKLAACCEALSIAVSWGEADDVLTDFNIELNLTSYNGYLKMSSDKKAQVCRSILNISKQSLTPEKIKNTFESAYKSVSEQTDNGKKNNSGNSGGGNGSSYSVSKPAVNDEEEEIVKFKDIDDCQWAREQIIDFYEKGFINGKSEDSFCPYDNVTRAEFIKILCLSLDITSEGECSFADLNKDDWSYPYISAAYKIGIVSGYEDGTVRGNNPVTREEMAVMAYRAAMIKGIQPEQVAVGVSFIDGEEISDWAYDAVMSLAKSNILHGMGADQFCPRKLAGRAETVVFLSNLRAANKSVTETKAERKG